jgi:hypothetical protein
MSSGERQHLRVLTAREHHESLALLVPIAAGGGHEVIPLLHAPDREFVDQASSRGTFAATSDRDVDNW